MFLIKSYIEHPDRRGSRKQAQQDLSFYFVDVDDTEEILTFVKKLNRNPIDGFLYLEYNGRFNFTIWDTMDSMWSYLLNMIEEFLEKNKSTVSFPSGVVEMENTFSEYLIFSSMTSRSEIKRKLPKQEFFKALLQGAHNFFSKMLLVLDNDRYGYAYELQKIKKLEKMIAVFDKRNNCFRKN